MLENSRKLPESHRKATYQDVLDASENMVAQLIDGKQYLHARPAGPHDRAGVFFRAFIGSFLAYFCPTRSRSRLRPSERTLRLI